MVSPQSEISKKFFGKKHFFQEDFDIVVFSHLRWEFVFQRPQHLLTRFAKKHKVLFVEEPLPVAEHEQGGANIYSPAANITVLQPKISWQHMGRPLADMVRSLAQGIGMKNLVVWFYSAQFIGVLPWLSHVSAIVYDCMDELSAFKGASPDLRIKEKNLLAEADVVFTGGKSLYEAKRTAHDKVYCFPSSVDIRHFSRMTKQKPADVANIDSPIIGFYGVLDERLDLGLLKQVAEKLPNCNFVLIGPVVKIHTEDLPQAPNLHYLGPKAYGDLPAYLHNFNVAMMPFALNESTQYISPTKTLEFMAAKKPIVSTAITDVVRDYAHVVSIAESAEDFSMAIARLLAETPNQRDERVSAQESILAQTSWDRTANAMEDIVRQTLKARSEKNNATLYGQAAVGA